MTNGRIVNIVMVITIETLSLLSRNGGKWTIFVT